MRPHTLAGLTEQRDMSLNEYERRTLCQIEKYLACGDPALAHELRKPAQAFAQRPDQARYQQPLPRGTRSAVAMVAVGLALLSFGAILNDHTTLLIGLFTMFMFPLPLQLSTNRAPSVTAVLE